MKGRFHSAPHPRRASRRAPPSVPPRTLEGGTKSRPHDFDVEERAVLAAAPHPIITLDASGTIRSASDSVERVFGWTAGELVGRNVSVLMPEAHHAAHDEPPEQYRGAGITSLIGGTHVLEGVRKSGERFPLELSVSRAESIRGEALFVGIIRDVTHHKRLERELRLFKDLALAIGSATSVPQAQAEVLRLIGLATGWDYGEIWTPRDGVLAGVASWVRPESGLESFPMCDITFPPGQGLPGRAWSSRQPVWEEDVCRLSPPEFCRSSAACAAGLRAGAAVPIFAAEELVAVLLFLARTSRREDRQMLELVQAAVAPLGSLIQRKRLEEALAEHSSRLEALVDERTEQLRRSHAKLQVAERLAAIGTLAAGLGHDMNNVLLPVRAHLNALRAQFNGDGPRVTSTHSLADARRHIDRIDRSIGYLMNLADGLHYLAMDPDLDDDHAGEQTTHLHSWWTQTGALISKSVPKHVRVMASIGTNLPPVAIAPHRLTQAVLNLVINAGEAIPPGLKRRQGFVRVIARTDETGHVRIIVADNGRGMTEEVKRRAFEMFFTTKPRGLGTGLGLPLVRKVIESAGGTIDIASEVGKGTTVTLSLPIAPKGCDPPIACVSLSDARAATLIRRLLEASGAVVRDGKVPRTNLWVIDPYETNIHTARRWVTGRPGRRVVLFGAPEPSSALKWNALRPYVIEDRNDFGAMRAALGRALSVV